jgi:hypothetical protein
VWTDGRCGEARPRWNSGFRLAALLVLALLTPPGASADVIPLSAEELVRSSEHIVVASVAESSCRWNDQHTLIFTDHRLLVEERLKGRGGSELVISIAGGTLDGETHRTSTSVHLEQGARYLLFVRDLEAGGFNPLAGAWQGAVRQMEGKSAADGTGVRHLAAVDFAALVDSVRALIQRLEISSQPPTPPTSPGAADHQRLPAKTFDRADRVVKAPLDGSPPAAPPAAASAPMPLHPVTVDMPPDAIHAAASPGAPSRYRWMRRPDPYIVWNPLPLDWVWSPHDQYMMSFWNDYGDVHRVMAPTGTWAWGNDRFDLCGWPDDATMIAQFGQPWDPVTLAITYYRWIGNGNIIEADIAFNPAYSWTLDNEFAAREWTNSWSFERTMLHELGHGWGLQHPWEHQNVWWDSIMNYAPKQFRLPTLYTDDTEASRTAYPGISLHDGLISCYTTEDTVGSNSATYVDAVPETGSPTSPPQVEHGSDFWLSGDFKIENAGTDNLVAPQVEVYLTPERMSWTSSEYLATKSYSSTIPPFYTFTFDLGTTTVPDNVPPGVYYVGLYLRDDTDDLHRNNSSWSNYPDTLEVVPHCPTPPDHDATLDPQGNWQSTPTLATGVGGCRVYRLDLEGSRRYDFSLCGNDGVGGFADPGDGDLRMYDPSGTELWYIDGASSCAWDASTLGTTYEGWSPPGDGTYYLEVSEFYGDPMTFVLAFRGVATADLIFADGFESGDTSAW